MITWNVSFDDVSFRSANLDLDSKALDPSKSVKDVLTTIVKLAGQEWSKYLNDPPLGNTQMDVKIIADDSTPQSEVKPKRDISYTIPFEINYNNLPPAGVVKSEAAFKINTGLDSNLSNPDIQIHVNSNFLRNHVTYDLTANRSGPISPDKADAVSVFMHEIGHGLAFNGLRDPSSGLITANLPLNLAPTETTFDKNIVEPGNGSLLFNGPNATLVYGAPIPLNWQAGWTKIDPYHLAAPDLNNDLLYGQQGAGFHPGMHYEVSTLDLAILADCGITNVAVPLTKAVYSNLIKNGSFEQGQDPGAYSPLSPGSTSITDWTVIKGGIDYYGTGWTASRGNRSLDLNGTPGVGGVSQTFSTIPGARYYVTFDMAGHPSGLDQTMGIEAANQKAQFSFKSGTDPNNLGWRHYAWDFVSNASQTTLSFYSLQTGYPYGGPALDNVSVEISHAPLLSSTVPSSNPPPNVAANPTAVGTPPPGFVTLGGSQGNTPLALPFFVSSSDRPEFIGGTPSIPFFEGAGSYPSTSGLAQLTGLSADQSGSELTDLLPRVFAQGAGSTMLSAGVMTPDLVGTSTGTNLISMQTDTWSSVG